MSLAKRISEKTFLASRRIALQKQESQRLADIKERERFHEDLEEIMELLEEKANMGLNSASVFLYSSRLRRESMISLKETFEKEGFICSLDKYSYTEQPVSELTISWDNLAEEKQ